MRADFDSAYKTLFVAAHGLYQLAAYLWDVELFHQLPMPNHKSFSKEYAVWRNTHEVHPVLFTQYPKPAINIALTSGSVSLDFGG